MVLEKRSNNKIKYLFKILLLSVFVFGYKEANAATLQVTSNTTTLSSGNISTLSVVINSEGVAVNNAEAKIIFPTDLLEVVSVSKSGSIFSLWVEEPTYSNITGVIGFNGGVPNPGFNGQNGTVLSIVVKAKKTGQANIIFSDAAVRANDGLGTDVLSLKSGKTLSIIEKTETSIVGAETSSAVALQVSSPTHVSQELWYRDDSPTFVWKIPEGVDSIQTGIFNNTSGSPKLTFTPAVKERVVKDLEDGIWYFKVRARKEGVWGTISTYIARIDNTIPKKNEVVFQYDDEKKILSIEADIVDETSGLDHYELYINDELVKNIPSEEFVNNIYNLEVNIPGSNTVKLVAVDRAGNSVESLGYYTATPISELVPTVNEPLFVSIGTLAIPMIYFVLISIIGALILIFGSFRLGRSYNKHNNKIKLRTALNKGDNTKVLLLLKKRLERHLEILQHTRHNRILSKEEREIKEAIEGDLDEVDRAIEEQK